MVIDQIENELLSLPELERARLAELLLASLGIDPEIQQSWLEEAKRRYDEIVSGQVQTIPASEVMREARLRLKS